MRSLESVRVAASRPVDIASLAAFRIIFGTVMFVSCVRLLASGWIDTMYIEPRWFFTYSGFDWVRPWPAWGLYLHYGVLAALALAVAVGAFHRVVTPLFTIGFAYTQLIDVTNYLNHHYLVVLLGAQLALLPANAAWSIDAWRSPHVRRATVPVWMVWLLRFQIGVVYVFAGLAKLKVDWLVHGQPLNLWLAARSETPIVGRWFAEAWVAYAMSWAGFLFDTTIALWLCWRRTRAIAYAVLIVFHAATGYLLNIGMFPVIMTSSALIFFSPSWPRVVLARLRRALTRVGLASQSPRSELAPTAPETALSPPPPRSELSPKSPGTEHSQQPPDFKLAPRAELAPPSSPSSLEPPSARPELARRAAGAPSNFVVAAIALHVLVQIALPLRHHIYPGSVLWNEDGMRFAWHVVVREKNGDVRFVAAFADGRRLEIPPRTYLTARQEREMGGQPDLILQLAHHIGRELHARGLRDFKMHAITAVSLNGRTPRAMIDPAVDLLQVSDSGPRTWVLAEPEEPPRGVRGVR